MAAISTPGDVVDLIKFREFLTEFDIEIKKLQNDFYRLTNEMKKPTVVNNFSAALKIMGY